MPRISIKAFLILQILFLFASTYNYILFQFKESLCALLEYSLLALLFTFCFLLSEKKWTRYLLSFFLFSYNFIVILQFSYFSLQRRFISITALDNYGKINLLPFDELHYFYFLIFFATILSFLIFRIKNIKFRLRRPYNYLFISTSLIVWIFLFVFPYSPLVSIVYTISGYISSDKEESIYLDNVDIDRLKYMTIDQTKDYPFIKKYIYNEVIQFQRSETYNAKPNIIHFIVEGLSARTIGCYNKKWKNLTPNIDNFRNKSMLVKNYFSHTQATYRGIRGQLSSIYPSFGGSNAIGWASDSSQIPVMELLCLPHVLNKNGYQTEMWLGCSFDEGMIGLQCLEHFGYQKVNGPAQMIPQKDLTNSALLPDRVVLKSLIRKLRDEKKEKPFYYSIYTTQTHAWVNSGKGDKVFSSANSETLNTIHNFDYWFGIFFKYFVNSEYFKNTVIVFSTDHCHFPSKDYTEVTKSDPNYEPYFFDRVPLIIYDPTHVLPGIWDNGSFTSLDLVPTLLHLLEFPNHINHFLGNSIFSKNVYDGRDFIPFYGNEYLVHYGNKIFQNDWIDSNHRNASFFRKVIDYQRSIEQQNRLWRRSFDSEIKIKQTAKP